MKNIIFSTFLVVFLCQETRSTPILEPNTYFPSYNHNSMNSYKSSPLVLKKEKDISTLGDKNDKLNTTVDKDKLFDFWVGKWELTWDEGNGKMGKGTNEIEKILDGKVIQENFQVIEGNNKGFKGISISVYQPRLDRWKQAWCDNQGGYFDFIGEFDDDNRIFKTQIIERGGKKIISRMVFKDIKKDSFIWDWESSYDRGVTWKLNWRINYKRVPSK